LLLGIVLVFCCLSVFSVYALSVVRKARVRHFFRQYILDPVPTSVAHIVVHQPMTHGGYGYVFGFSINDKDLELIRESRPFRETRDISYGDGVILWEWGDWNPRTSPGEEGGFGLSPYVLVRQPSWFNLASWENPDAYAVLREDKDTKDTDVHVLIYNSGLQQAYVIVFHYDGRGL